MKSKEIKTKLEANKDKLPLYFNDAICTKVVNKDLDVRSKKFKDEDYDIYSFYKPITRF